MSSPVSSSVRCVRAWRWLVVLFVSALAAGLVGCDLTADEPGPDTAQPDGRDPDSDLDRDGGLDTRTPGDQPCLDVAAEDADEDGLVNGLEDLNHNCVRDPGESDWQDADTDKDGLSDGQEDLNQNGRYEPELGEFDPRAKDSDGNGIDDGSEPLAAVCRRDLITQVRLGPAQGALSVLAAASDAFRVEPRGEGVATFAIDGQIYGYVVRRESLESDVLRENGHMLFALGQAGFPVLVEFQDQPFETWQAPHSDPARSLAPRPAIRSELNLGVQSASLDAVRDALAGAHVALDAPGSGATPAPSCVGGDEVVLWQTTELRDDGHTLVVGALTCRSFIAGGGAAYFTFDDATNTTMVAPAQAPRVYKPSDGRCEQTETLVEPTDVDFLWVVDTSGSMTDEQQAVSAAAELFFETLVGSGSQWRLAVTTTEVWALDYPERTPDADLTEHDPAIDLESGLVGRGFLDGSMPDAIDRFQEYVTTDRNCTTREPVGANICGSGLESGLQSGLSVLDRVRSEARPAHQLRPDALTAVIWLSDEDDQWIKPDIDFEPLPEGPEREALLAEVREAWVASGVLGCAIVGDQGVGKGGVCQALGVDGNTVDGAQYGSAYIDVAQATGGFWASICNTDLQVTIDNCVRAAFGIAGSYPLSGRPLSGTLKVAVDGAVMARSRSAGWSYDVVRNAIVFHGVSLPAGAAITVSYREWQLIDG